MMKQTVFDAATSTNVCVMLPDDDVDVKEKRVTDSKNKEDPKSDVVATVKTKKLRVACMSIGSTANVLQDILLRSIANDLKCPLIVSTHIGIVDIENNELLPATPSLNHIVRILFIEPLGGRLDTQRHRIQSYIDQLPVGQGPAICVIATRQETNPDVPSDFDDVRVVVVRHASGSKTLDVEVPSSLITHVQNIIDQWSISSSNSYDAS